MSNEYLLDDNAEIFIGFHTKIKDMRTWLLSEKGQKRLKAVLTGTPFPIEDESLINLDELKPIIEITNRDLLSKIDLKGLQFQRYP